MRHGAYAQKDPNADSALQKRHFIIITKSDPGNLESKRGTEKTRGGNDTRKPESGPWEAARKRGEDYWEAGKQGNTLELSGESRAYDRAGPWELGGVEWQSVCRKSCGASGRAR